MAKNWIQKAIKHPGALTETAKERGGFNSKEGTIKGSWLAKAAKAKGKLGMRARLAETLKSFK